MTCRNKAGSKIDARTDQFFCKMVNEKCSSMKKESLKYILKIIFDAQSMDIKAVFLKRSSEPSKKGHFNYITYLPPPLPKNWAAPIMIFRILNHSVVNNLICHYKNSVLYLILCLNLNTVYITFVMLKQGVQIMLKLTVFLVQNRKL